MKRITDLLDALAKKLDPIGKRLFSSTYQVQRVLVLVVVVLAVTSISFASYYYYDRYYTAQPKVMNKVLENAEQAVRDNPNDPAARLTLAEAYMMSNQFDDASTQAKNVMDVYPDNQRAWFIYGVANALGGKPGEAVGPLQKYVDANKDSDMPALNRTLQSAAYYLGDSYLRLGQPDKAVEPLELDVKWSKTDSDAMYKLGIAYSGVQRYEEAVNMFQQATVFVPNYTEAYEGMSAAFEALGEPDYVNYAKGMIAYSKKDYPTAIDLLLRSVQAKPEFVPAYEGLGLTYEAMNDLQNAKINYEIAVQLNPAGFTATTGLDRVNTLLGK